MDSLRRVPATDIDAIAGDPTLEALIRDEIASNGPMTFARFMELALYHPQLGYYRNEAARPGREGRLPDGPGGAPDLRPRDCTPRDRCVGGVRKAQRIHHPGARRGEWCARGRAGRAASRRGARPCFGCELSRRRGRAPAHRRADGSCRGHRGSGRWDPDQRPRRRKRGPRCLADPPRRWDERWICGGLCRRG